MPSQKKLLSSRFDLIRTWSAKGSPTVFGIVDLTIPNDKRLIHLVLTEDGRVIFPTDEPGMKYGLFVYNGNLTEWRAYPAYVGGQPIYEGGPMDPSETPSSHMWELRPNEWMIIKGIQKGSRRRPFVVVPVGAKQTIAEANGTPALAADIVVYERKPAGTSWDPDRDMNVGWGDPAEPTPITISDIMFNASIAEAASQESSQARSADFESVPVVGTGLGEVTISQAYPTGRHYQHNAQPVVFVQMMPRRDLYDQMLAALGSGWTWDEPFPQTRNWFLEPWNWRDNSNRPRTGGIMPDVPVAEPDAHDPRRHHYWDPRTRRWDW